MKGFFTAFLLLALVVSLAISGCAQQAPAPAPEPEEVEVTEWDIQYYAALTPIPLIPGSDYLDHPQTWAPKVEEVTNGTVKVNLFSCGSIVSAEETCSAAMTGVTDGFAGWATVYGGDVPEGYLAYGLALGCADQYEAWELMWGNPKYRLGDLVQEGFHEKGLHWASWEDQGPNGLVTTFPATTLAELKGKKCRAGGPQAVFFEAIGGNPVSMPWDDIYMGIKLGTIDGTFCDIAGAEMFRFYEACDYEILPPWCPAQHEELLINLDSWNALEQWQQDAIMGIMEDNYFYCSEEHGKFVELFREHLREKGGEVIALTAEEQTKMTKIIVDNVWPKVASLSPRCAEGVEIYKQFLRDKGRL